jgi:hypothetical protein
MIRRSAIDSSIGVILRGRLVSGRGKLSLRDFGKGRSGFPSSIVIGMS